MEEEMTCCFSGHRPVKLPWGLNENDPRCLALKAEITARLDGIYQAGYRRFICGMAIGCDMYFAEAVLALRKEHPDVVLEAAVPCGTQPDRWNRAQRQRYNELLNSCNKVTMISVCYPRLHDGAQPVHGQQLLADAVLLQRAAGRNDEDHSLRPAQRRGRDNNRYISLHPLSDGWRF